jgi:hypothetical protein
LERIRNFRRRKEFIPEPTVKQRSDVNAEPRILKSEVIQKNEGFGFSVKVEKQNRVYAGARYALIVETIDIQTSQREKRQLVYLDPNIHNTLKPRRGRQTPILDQDRVRSLKRNGLLIDRSQFQTAHTIVVFVNSAWFCATSRRKEVSVLAQKKAVPGEQIFQ